MRFVLMSLRTVVVLGALLVGYLVLPVHDSALLPSWLAAAATLAAISGASLFARSSILRSEFPALRAGHTIAFVVALSVVGFAAVYASVSYSDAAAFSERLDRVGALYLSVVTASTVGFGDIQPRSDLARIAVMFQIVTSVGLVAAAVQMIRRAASRRSADLDRSP